MARRPRARPVPLSREKLEKGFSRFMSRHHRPQDGEEAYDFDIKVQKIDIPDIVRELRRDAEINDMADAEMQSRLRDFADSLNEIHPWAKEWYQTGRSGGWLTLVTDMPVLTDNWEIPRTDIAEGPKEWAPTHALGAAAKRLRALEDIKMSIDDGISMLIHDLESPSWWGVTPKDWMPKKKKTSMDGIFDFLRRKKLPESRETPIEVVPPSGGIVPAAPPPGTFANPFEILAPPPSRGLTPVQPGPTPVFEMLAPREAPPLPPVRFEPPRPPAGPVEPLMPRFEIFEPPPPQAKMPKPRPGHPRDVIDWRLPSPEELAQAIYQGPSTNFAFQVIRALRHEGDWKQTFRWASRMPDEYVVVPITKLGENAQRVDELFQIPAEVVDVYRERRTGELRPEIWDEVYGPLFEIFTQAMELIKPDDIPGWFGIEYLPVEDQWAVAYFEPV